MTRVTLLLKGGRLVGFTAHGHTGYASEGSDIVCSAVSAVTQTAVIGLTEIVGIQPELEIREAELSCILTGDITRRQEEGAQLILDTMAAGLRSIASGYGEYISITERKV